MKREINCPQCADAWKRHCGIKLGEPVTLSLVMAIAEGESMKQVRGTARGSYMCDGCGAAIERGDDAVAVTIFSDSIPYSEWESNYIFQSTGSGNASSPPR